jgi:hypothetical protein
MEEVGPESCGSEASYAKGACLMYLNELIKLEV